MAHPIMEQTRYVLMLCIIAVWPAGAVLHEPFPSGALTGHMGTILYGGGISSRAPHISAMYLHPESRSTGVSVAVLGYYDAMDNYRDRSLTTVCAGGWVSRKRWACKGAVTQFDALGMYYEQSGYFSASAVLCRDVRVGLEMTGTRFFLSDTHYDPLHMARGGVACCIPLSHVLLTAAVNDVTVHSARVDGTDPFLKIEGGIHSTRHAYGAQGIVFRIVPAREEPLSISLGQELSLHKNIALHAALHTNPFLFSFGLQAVFGRGGVTAAMVNHPVLGWSRGFSAEYLVQKR